LIFEGDGLRKKNKFFLFAFSSSLTIAVCIGLIVLYIWQQLAPAEQTVIWGVFKAYFGYIFVMLIMVASTIGFALDVILNTYMIPLSKLVDEFTVITTVNSAHRIKLEGSRHIVRLAQIINETADQLEKSRTNIRKKVTRAKARIELEKNTLAAVIAGLPDGVVICNEDGQILLYNQRARHLLSGKSSLAVNGIGSGGLLGLGRSIFGVIDKNLIVHILDEMAHRIKNGDADAIYHFNISGQANEFLRIQSTPILRVKDELYGFILVVYDITQQVELAGKRDLFLETMTISTRSSIGAIRAAIETIIEYPRMRNDEQERLKQVILNEAINLSAHLNRLEKAPHQYLRSQWSLDSMLCSDLLQAIEKSAQDRLALKITCENQNGKSLIKVDRFSFVYAILFLSKQIKDAKGVEHIVCRLSTTEKLTRFDLIWQGTPLPLEALQEWKEQELLIRGEGVRLTLKNVIERHGAEIWSQTDTKMNPCLRILLPSIMAAEKKIRWRARISMENRPEFYDFDLFNQPGQVPEIDDRPLSELAFTVFDTETTGLNPSAGDEIISVGALRIINNRLLYKETFEQLIDPRRVLPTESIKFHGIQPEMLEGQPTINEVLPMFHRFCEDTILIAHNAAFDMRMLQLKEKETGIAFINPVLDTLLLSAVVHSSHEHHNLEDIAKRLGIRIVGRHTALGDAITTGEIFLKLIPLLKKKGIHTLKQARLASQKTYLSRLKY
jgi:DNA polymerase-3 subunit epsilon